jgi:uncharacterized protein (TIGR02466 family)
VNVIDIFSSFLALDVLELDNTELEAFCRGKIANDKTNSGFLDLTAPELTPLLSIITQKINELHLNLGLSPDYVQEISLAWANRNYPNSATQSHSHPESFFSCVYYVTGDESNGNIHFVTPITQMLPTVRPPMVRDWNKYWNEFWKVPPHANMLVIFPSWIWHYVDVRNSTTDRISIAFDTKIKLK